jgi:hypothetical protein
MPSEETVMSVITIQTTFVLQTCPRHECGIEFAIPNGFDDRRRNDGKSFHCPNGHSMSYGAPGLEPGEGSGGAGCMTRLTQDFPKQQERLQQMVKTLDHIGDVSLIKKLLAEAEDAAQTKNPLVMLPIYMRMRDVV